ncbi:hypothetical protein F1880_002434 [Penicillium rolfsii]|nr:hypothetical protein F1880_002434 [Penicillium rolfsii]
MQHTRVNKSQFPQELVEEVNRAHEEAAEEEISLQDIGPYVFVVVHEIQGREESEFIIEGVFHTLNSANLQTMNMFEAQYPDYLRSSFYAQGTWQSIGENSVGWYVSRNGTLSLEIHDPRRNTNRIYAEKHYVE